MASEQRDIRAAGDALDPREAVLRRRKALAAALLVAAGLVLALARWADSRHPNWAFGLLAAMAEAALVGGLADWFAVVALFRHPLGQRWIPHTAIIPAKKEALGRSLADFICNHFLERQQVVAKLEAFDAARALAHRLADEHTAQRVGQVVTRLLPHLLAAVNSRELQAFLHGLVRERLDRVDFSRVAAFGLEQLTAGGRHHELVDAALAQIRDALQAPDTREALSRRVAEELWGFLSYMKLDGIVADRVADKLIAGVTATVADMADDRDHEMRRRIGRKIVGLSQRLREDPALRARVDGFRDQLLDDGVLGEYVGSLWSELLAWVESDITREDSRIGARVALGTRELGTRLLGDPAMRDWINSAVRDAVEPLIDRYRGRIRGFIVERVQRWSADELTRELELAVGADLQFIRYNGTAVGALVGGLIFAVVEGARLLAP